MRFYFSFILILLFFSSSIAELKVGRISSTEEVDIQHLLQLGAEILSDESKDFIDIIFDDDVEADIIDAGYSISDVHPFAKTGLTDLDPEYHTLEEYFEELSLLADTYPDLCKLDSIGRAEQFERTIWCMKLSDNPQIEEDETALLYVGVHHACEVMGGETIMYMINLFLENYGIDPEITFWLDNYEIFFVPVVNPDGYFAVTDSISLFWRKNANDTNNNGIFYEVWGGTWWNDDTDGVDLNRNYDWYWNMGGAGGPLNYYYRGESAFSEHETQAIRDLGLQQNFLCDVSFHSYGEVVIHPWNFQGNPAPDQNVLDEVAIGIASGIIKDNGGFYNTDIYDAQSGQCRNWFYGNCGTLGFCVEVNPYPVFIPPGEEVLQRARNYYNGVKYIIERADKAGITGRITDSATGESIPARITIANTMNYQVEPRFANPQFGRYTRLLTLGGNYRLTVEYPDYIAFDTTFTILEDTLKVIDIELESVNFVKDNSGKYQPDSYIMDFDCSPNPFNTSTNITFELAAAGLVKLIVHDVSGQIVEELFDGVLESGANCIVWNAKNISSGVYFVSLNTANQNHTVKTILLK